MKWRVWGVLAGVAFLGQAAADTLDLNLHSDALRVTYARDVGKSGRGLMMDAGYLYAENPHENDHVLHLGLQVAGQNWSRSGDFDIGLGGRVVAVGTDAGDGLNVAFGGSVRFSPMHRVGLGAQAFYAPEITSFQDSKEYREWALSVDYQLLTQGFVYVGYRRVDSDMDNHGVVQVDDNLHLGMRIIF